MERRNKKEAEVGDKIPRLALWPGNLDLLQLEEQLDAGQAGGFHVVPLGPHTIKRALQRGLSFDDILAEAARRAVAIDILDGLSSWLPIRHPSASDPVGAAHFNRHDVQMGEALDIAAALGMTSIVAMSVMDRGIPLDLFIDPFGTFCDRASSYGIRIDLEFAPYWSIPDLASSWRIVQEAGRANSGLMIDTWHAYWSSNDINRELDLIDEIPASFLTSLQLADQKRPRAGMTMRESRAALGRLFAGEGDIPIRPFVKALLSKGGLKTIGPEVFARPDTYAALSISEVGELAGRTTRNIIALADKPATNAEFARGVTTHE